MTTARRVRRGLSMVEAIVSLLICSILLLAAGTAFTASASAVQQNGDFFAASQTARVTMAQIIAEIRQADSIAGSAGNTYVDVIRPSTTRLTNETSRRYAYDSTNKQLTLTISYSTGSPTSYVLAHNISAATIGPAQTGTDSKGATVVQRLPVSFTVKINKNALTVDGSAGPRRAIGAF